MQSVLYIDNMTIRLSDKFKLKKPLRLPDQVAETLEKEINSIPGVIENGLFIDLVDEVIVGSKQGIITLEEQCLQ